MIFFTILVFAIPFALALALSWNSSLGKFRKSALNPFLLISAYVLIVGLDFASIELQGHGMLAMTRVTAAPFSIAIIQVKYALMIVAALIGCWAAMSLERTRRSEPQPSRLVADTRFSLAGAYVLILTGWVVVLSRFGIDVSSYSDTVSVKIETAGDAPFFIFSMLLLPSLTFALAKQPAKLAIALLLVSVSVLFLSNSRTRILYALIPFAFYLYRVRGIPMPRSFFTVGASVIGLLAVIAVNARTLVSFRRAVTTESLLYSSNIMDLNDFSFAEVAISMNRLPARSLEAYFGQDIVGFFLAAVPRAIAPIKPEIASRQFASLYNDFQFTRYGRGLTIGGINEVMYDYWFPIALVVIALLGFVWTWGFLRSSRSRTIVGFGWTVGMYTALYAFLKAELSAAGQIVSVFAFYTMLVWFLQSWGTRQTPQRRVPLRRPAERIRKAI